MLDAKACVVPRTRDYARTTLRPRHRAILHALTEAFFAHDGGPDDARLEAFVDEIDAFLSPTSKTLRFILMLSLTVVQLTPPFLVRRFAPFSELPLDEREKVVERMETSRFIGFVLVFAAWKTILSFVYFEEPDDLASMNYPGPERERYKLAVVSESAPASGSTAREEVAA